jgi:hypothetical protein
MAIAKLMLWWIVSIGDYRNPLGPRTPSRDEGRLSSHITSESSEIFKKKLMTWWPHQKVILKQMCIFQKRYNFLGFMVEKKTTLTASISTWGWAHGKHGEIESSPLALQNPWRIHGAAIYGNIYHQYIPNIWKKHVPNHQSIYIYIPCMVYMLTWLGYIDGIHVTIYSSTMDPSWVCLERFEHLICSKYLR